MSKPILFGASYSVYVRICRLTLHEKQVEYTLVPVDIFSPAESEAEYLARQPFGKIPAFEHAGFRLYETGAISRYVDETFSGLALQPAEPKERARMNQIISIADSYVYPHLVWGMYVELVEKEGRGEIPDERRVTAARRQMMTCLNVLSDFLADELWFGGEYLTLADLYLAPMIEYFLMVPDGNLAFSERPNLYGWWQRVRGRDSMKVTRSTFS